MFAISVFFFHDLQKNMQNCFQQQQEEEALFSLWSYKYIFMYKDYILIEKGAWLPEITGELKTAGSQICKYINTSLGQYTHIQHSTHSEH